MRNLYNFYLDCGRMGSLDGLFVASPEEVEAAIGKEAYFGEVLGKHSEISVIVLEENITLVSDDQDKVEWLVEVTGGNTTISGFNPLEYIEEESDYDDVVAIYDVIDWLPEDEEL